MRPLIEMGAVSFGPLTQRDHPLRNIERRQVDLRIVTSLELSAVSFSRVVQVPKERVP